MGGDSFLALCKSGSNSLTHSLSTNSGPINETVIARITGVLTAMEGKTANWSSCMGIEAGKQFGNGLVMPDTCGGGTGMAYEDA